MPLVLQTIVLTNQAVIFVQTGQHKIQSLRKNEISIRPNGTVTNEFTIIA